MEKTLSVERLYSLGDFKNIKFSSAITAIPESISLNSEAMDLLYLLQLLEIEKSFRRYLDLQSNFLKLDAEKVMEHLEEMRMTTLETLLSKLKNGHVKGE